MKYITFTVPCYNSASYMERCIDSLLAFKNEVEIIIVDDGSTDRTPEIADQYALLFPETVKVIHKSNGGHGSGINAGLSQATGRYFKVVDSDDWLDTTSLRKVLFRIMHWERQEKWADMIVCNYVYDHLYENRKKSISYKNVFKEERMLTWNDIGIFSPSQYLVMHSLIFRTDILKRSGITLPEHTFYVDNIFAYRPLPYVENIYYINTDLYHYFIGRADQSVNEEILKQICGNIGVPLKIEKTDIKQINEAVQVIQNNIQKHINQITEQVYQKIEKKLQNERRRRGL